MPDDSLAARSLAFIRDAGTSDFEDLALALFERQFEQLSSYREFCESLGASPATVTSWREIPAAPWQLVTASEIAESGTRTRPPGSGLEKAVLQSAAPEFFEADRLHVILGSDQTAGSAAWILEAFGGAAAPESLVSSGRLDVKQIRSWLAARQRDRKPVSLAAHPSGFAGLIQLLERRAVKFRLPPGSEALCVQSIEDAGAKPGGPWKESLLPLLGLAPEVCRRLLGGPRGSTPLREEIGTSASGFRVPHWVRVESAGDDALSILDLTALYTPARRLVRASGLRFLE